MINIGDDDYLISQISINITFSYFLNKNTLEYQTELYNRFIDANNLYKAFQLAKINSDWKESVQIYETNIISNIFNIQKSLKDKTYKQKPFYTFILNERGKTRFIKSLHISDRVVQRCFCDEVLIPILNRYLIYDNGASVKNKGISFTKNRLKHHLIQFYNKYGNNGYILKIDFSKFFDNIDHEVLFKMIEEKIKNKDILYYFKLLVDSFKIDCSNISEENYQRYKNGVYNSLEYNKLDKSKFISEKYLYKSVGIGSQISQIIGIFYLTPIDNFCKIVERCKYYGRYMDDIYIIHQSKEYLRLLLDKIELKVNDLKLKINRNKTQIIRLTKTFVYMQHRYNLTNSGKILLRLVPKTIVRERRKLKKYRHLLDTNKIDFKHILNAFKSWYGNNKKYKCYKSLKNIENLFKNLFEKEIINYA